MGKATVLLVPYYHAYDPELVRPCCLKYQNTSGEEATTRFTYNLKGQNDRAFYRARILNPAAGP